MENNELRFIIAKNLTEYRKLNKLTQLELAEKLNYSDKAVSKWERGESIPDVMTLSEIAELYDVTVNDFLLPKRPKRRRGAIRRKILVPMISVAIVWLTAVVAFTVCSLLPINLSVAWLAFVYAIPVSFIVLTVYSTIWWSQISTAVCISALIWTVTLSIVVSLPISGITLLWTVAAVLQVIELLWFFLRYRSSSRK